jgi:hypothetical protein
MTTTRAVVARHKLSIRWDLTIKSPDPEWRPWRVHSAYAPSIYHPVISILCRRRLLLEVCPGQCRHSAHAVARLDDNLWHCGARHELSGRWDLTATWPRCEDWRAQVRMCAGMSESCVHRVIRTWAAHTLDLLCLCGNVHTCVLLEQGPGYRMECRIPCPLAGLKVGTLFCSPGLVAQDAMHLICRSLCCMCWHPPRNRHWAQSWHCMCFIRGCHATAAALERSLVACTSWVVTAYWTLWWEGRCFAHERCTLA